MEIKKISQNQDGIAITYTQHTGTAGVNNVTLESKDEPKPEFSEAMQNLKKPYKKICGFTPEFAADFIIKSVSFKFGSSGNKSAIISGSKPMEVGTPLNVSTPSRMMDSEEDEEAKTQLDADSVIALEALETEARAYINGDRQQAQLPLDGDDKEADEEG